MQRNAASGSGPPARSTRDPFLPPSRPTTRHSRSGGGWGLSSIHRSSPRSQGQDGEFSPGSTFASAFGGAPADLSMGPGGGGLPALPSLSPAMGRTLSDPSSQSSPSRPTPGEADGGLTAELLGTYVSRRRVLERAAQLAADMRSRADEIAEFEERTRMLVSAGGLTESREKVMAAMQEGDVGRAASGGRTGRRERSPPHSLLAPLAEDALGGGRSRNGSARRGGDADGLIIPVGTAVSEAEELRARIQEKSERLDRLRGVQRTITELDEVADERRTVRHRAWRRQAAKAMSPTAAAEADSGVSGKESGAQDGGLSPDRRKELAANDFDHEASASPPVVTEATADMEAYELRKAFNALLRDGGEEGGIGPDSVAPPPPPSPPPRFSSHALAVTLERLGNSLAALIEITDAICVLATFKARDEQVNISQHMHLLVAHVLYVQRAHAVALRHLGHFESGERALVEGAASELNSLREQFLFRKEALTAQEQRERQAEDARNAVRARLQLLLTRMTLWSEACLGERPQRPLSSLARRSTVASASSGVRDRPMGVRSSMTWLPPSRRVSMGSTGTGVATRASTPALVEAPAATSPPEESRAATVARAVDGRAEGGAVGAARTLAQELPPYARGVGYGGGLRGGGGAVGAEAESEADALERRLAQRWGNPYVTRALQAVRSGEEAPLVTFLRSAHENHGRGSAAPGGAAAQPLAEAISSRSPSAASPWLPQAAMRWSVLGSASSLAITPGMEMSGAGGGLAGLSASRCSTSLPSPCGGVPVRASWGGESRAAATARLLSLLQSLLRAVPVAGPVEGEARDAATGAGEEAEELASSHGSEGAAEVAMADPELAERSVRLATRGGIQRLIRYLSQVVAKDKERAMEIAAS